MCTTIRSLFVWLLSKFWMWERQSGKAQNSQSENYLITVSCTAVISLVALFEGERTDRRWLRERKWSIRVINANNAHWSDKQVANINKIISVKLKSLLSARKFARISDYTATSGSSFLCRNMANTVNSSNNHKMNGNGWVSLNSFDRLQLQRTCIA